MSVITRSMAKKLAMAEVVHQQPSESSPWPSITDLPPEVLEMILKNLDCGQNSMLPYRLVSPLWKSIIDDLLEKKTLKGDVDGCPTLRTSNEWLTVRCPGEMLLYNGNPFPSSALFVTGRQRPPRGGYLPFRYYRDFHLENIMSKVGSHLTTFIMEYVRLRSTEYICKTLSHLTNLRALKIKSIQVLMKKEEPFGSLPALPHLTKLELNSNVVASSDWKSVKFCSWFVDACAEQLEYLELKPSIYGIRQLDPLPSSSFESSPMQKLRRLKVVNAGPKFFQLSCSPPLKHLYIGRFYTSKELNLAVLMAFVDKFSNTLETLDLDVKWSQLYQQPKRVGEGDGVIFNVIQKQIYDEDTIRTGGKLSTATLVFPKLTKLTFPYPSDAVESAVISKMMLPKFPSLRELKLGYCREVLSYRQDLDNDAYRQAHGLTINEFLMEEDYWKLCSKLTLISVWYTGELWEVLHYPNFPVFSSRKEDSKK